MLFLLIGMFHAFQNLAQNYEPTILVLSPYEVVKEPKFEKEIKEFDKNIKKRFQISEKDLKEYKKQLAKEPKNIQIMTEKQISFADNINFYNSISHIAVDYLSYRFYERFTNLLIYPIKETSNGNIKTLSKLAKEHNMQYVLNFPYVKSYLSESGKRIQINIQLYDNEQQKIILHKKFIGMDRNPGSYFACSDSSLACTVNQAMSQILPEIIHIIANNSPTILKERDLAQKRFDLLMKKYYSQTPEKEILNILSKNDKSISKAGFYQGFMDKSKTKFVGFFALNSKASNFKELQKQKDKEVKIITDNVSDLDNIPRVYANIIIGILYQNKWYIKKENVTYFTAKNMEGGRKEYFANLMIWNFFKENSTEFNPEFWETNLFAKVKDVTKEPDYEKYKEMYAHRERKNKDYIGMYEIVADELKKEKKANLKKFEKEVSQKFVKPFFEKQKSSKYFEDYDQINNFILIYPKDTSIILIPQKIEKKKESYQLKYFLFFRETQEFYEWNYLKPKNLNAKPPIYGSEIIEHLASVVEWNFSFDTLDDEEFWQKYILKQDNGKYKYLKKIE